MGQLGFFDTEKRLAALSAKGDPLEAIDRLVPLKSFRADIEAVVLTTYAPGASSSVRAKPGRGLGGFSAHTAMSDHVAPLLSSADVASLPVIKVEQPF
jgi:hypothetical protein